MRGPVSVCVSGKVSPSFVEIPDILIMYPEKVAMRRTSDDCRSEVGISEGRDDNGNAKYNGVKTPYRD